MAKRKPIRGKKSAARKISARKKSPGKKIVSLKKSAAGKKSNRVKRLPARKKPFKGRRLSRGETPFDVGSTNFRRGLGAGSAGQSGATQGLSRTELADSESVEELAAEGQDYEAEVVSGVEGAPDPDQGEVRTREVPEDDVPSEYLDNN
ncbi:MAG TPA: hypothetical protein VKR82_01420 [Candidatus Acidoferrales bacterium]|nr:hypothetical protein [Candidatus Acidoferrales bacterium]